jgi:hypothetical protein
VDKPAPKSKENVGTGRDDHTRSVLKHPLAERRKDRREMHLDRRKSTIDLIEHVSLGVRCDRATSDDPRARNRRRAVST